MSHCFGNPGMVRKPRSIDWQPHEIEQLRTLAAEGKTPREIGAILGRSESATWRKGYKLGVFARRKQFWLASEIRELRRLAKTHTYASAAKVLGKTTKAVGSKAKELHISFRKYGEAHHSAIYTKAEIQRVFELKAQGMSQSEIAKCTGISAGHISDIQAYATRFRDSYACPGNGASNVSK